MLAQVRDQLLAKQLFRIGALLGRPARRFTVVAFRIAAEQFQHVALYVAIAEWPLWIKARSTVLPGQQIQAVEEGIGEQLQVLLFIAFHGIALYVRAHFGRWFMASRHAAAGVR